MTKNEITERYKNICSAVYHKEICKAFDLLKKFIDLSKNGRLFHLVEKEEFNYKNMLMYTFKGVDDPQREKVYSRILIKLLDIADQAYQILLLPHYSSQTALIKKTVADQKIQDMEQVHLLVQDMIVDIDLDMGAVELELSSTGKHAINDVFGRLCLVDKYDDYDFQLAKAILNETLISEDDKCLVVSAVSVGLFNNFDVKKINFLFEALDVNSPQIKQRALFGLIVGLYLHDKRLSYYPEIMNRLSILNEGGIHTSLIQSLLLQLIRSKDTERLTKTMQEEIIPEMMKLKPDISTKLDIQDLVDDLSEDKNPNWEKFFPESSELMDKIQKFSELQLEGADVLMSAFSVLKHFPFFSTMNNWFRPFSKDNDELREALKNESERIKGDDFLESLQKATHMCNSDKYSFMFNIPSMPEQQKELLTQFFGAELSQVQELSMEENILNNEAANRVIFTQYTQDVYRFFKLSPQRNDFVDPFSSELDIYNSHIYNTLNLNFDVLRQIGEFYFEKSHFQNAIEVFLKLIEAGIVSDELYEKLAFSYQKTGNYLKALEYYKKAELFDTNRTWNLQKMAFCYRKLKDHEKALNIWLELLDLDPDNLFYQASAGQAYLDLGNYQEAVRYYYRIEFSDAENIKVKRPLAWCNFILQKYEESFRYYEILMENNPTRYDLLNYGHALWCDGKPEKAAELYLRSVKHKDSNLSDFIRSFEQDKEVLMNNGISEKDIFFMMDHVQYLLHDLV